MELIKHYSYYQQTNNIELGEVIENANDKLTVITSFTDRDKAILADQMESSSQNYINAVARVENKDFVKAFKPVYYAASLNDASTEYAVIMDGYDTVVNSFEGIEDIPASYNKKIVYGAWWMHFPTYFDVDFGSDNDLRYLNSGVVVGKTSDLKEFYGALSTYIQDNYPNSTHWLKDYEQYWLYKFLVKHEEYVEKVGIDYNEILVVNYPIKPN